MPMPTGLPEVVFHQQLHRCPFAAAFIDAIAVIMEMELQMQKHWKKHNSQRQMKKQRWAHKKIQTGARADQEAQGDQGKEA